jgi:protein tyrosine/serine phosphatase
MSERFLDLSGAHNFRDLGGLPTVDGRHTRTRVLYRSDGLWGLTPDDAHALEGLGLKTVLDLRWPEEAERDGRWPFDETCRYVNVPFFPNPIDRPPDAPQRSVDFGAYYLWALEEAREQAATALKVIADRDALPLVFHCTAGKDRTGVLSALILGCAGVSREAIVDDYACSSERMEALIAKWSTNPAYGVNLEKVPPEVLAADPATMRRFLDLLDEGYGGARGWAKAAGLRGEELDALASALVE